MNDVRICENRLRATLLLKKAGLGNVVKISVMPGNDERSQYYNTNNFVMVGTFDASIFKDMYGRVHGKDEMYTCILDKYFDLDIFINYFINRKDWLLADQDIKRECSNMRIHPEKYKAGMDLGCYRLVDYI